MGLDPREEMLFRSSSPMHSETDELESLLLSQEVQDRESEDDYHLLGGMSHYDEDEESDSIVFQFDYQPSPRAQADSFLAGQRRSRRTSCVVKKIEAIFDDICQGLNSGESEVQLVLSPCYSKGEVGEDLRMASLNDDSFKVISFPSRNSEEAWRFG